jgi:hypothetical protein
VCDAAEAIWTDELIERTLVERRVTSARMAQAEEWDTDLLPDVDTALERFAAFLYADVDSPTDLTPEDERRLAVGLGRKR